MCLILTFLSKYYILIVFIPSFASDLDEQMFFLFTYVRYATHDEVLMAIEEMYQFEILVVILSNGGGPPRGPSSFTLSPFPCPCLCVKNRVIDPPKDIGLPPETRTSTLSMYLKLFYLFHFIY